MRWGVDEEVLRPAFIWGRDGEGEWGLGSGFIHSILRIR